MSFHFVSSLKQEPTSSPQKSLCSSVQTASGAGSIEQDFSWSPNAFAESTSLIVLYCTESVPCFPNLKSQASLQLAVARKIFRSACRKIFSSDICQGQTECRLSPSKSRLEFFHTLVYEVDGVKRSYPVLAYSNFLLILVASLSLHFSTRDLLVLKMLGLTTTHFLFHEFEPGFLPSSC